MGSLYSLHATGLVDAGTSEEFDEMLSNLQSIWQKREAKFSSKSPLMYQWFVKYHAEDVRNFMIVPVCKRVRLGKPPTHFMTNANESINNVIKQALHYEEDKFCNEMFKLIKIQYQELDKAVIRNGEYHFQANFTYLEKPLAVWIKMSVEQRRRHTQKVMHATVKMIHLQMIVMAIHPLYVHQGLVSLFQHHQMFHLRFGNAWSPKHRLSHQILYLCHQYQVLMGKVDLLSSCASSCLSEQ